MNNTRRSKKADLESRCEQAVSAGEEVIVQVNRANLLESLQLYGVKTIKHRMHARVSNDKGENQKRE